MLTDSWIFNDTSKTIWEFDLLAYRGQQENITSDQHSPRGFIMIWFDLIKHWLGCVL